MPAAAIRPDKRRRRVLVVVDVGAGTSDFGAFVTAPGDGSGRLASSSVAPLVIAQGNFENGGGMINHGVAAPRPTSVRAHAMKRLGPHARNTGPWIAAYRDSFEPKLQPL